MKPFFLFLFLLSVTLVSRAQEYPHILVKDAQKQEILQKIEQHEWAKQAFQHLSDHITPYAERHQDNPVWITSRYLMNRVPGKRYTRFISDSDGTQLIGYEGDAPVPTIRVSPHKRSPVGYRMPTIEEVVPYDTSMMMSLQWTATGEYEITEPRGYVGNINRRINELAYESAVLYWLTGKEMYAKFSADLLDQWAKGAYYQEVIEGPGRTGFINIQTLGDEGSKEMVLAYDFVQPYMKRRGYNLSYYQPVFEKVAWTMAFRGLTENNWYAAESSTMVAAALALEDPEKRDYYLQFYLSKDNIVSPGTGQRALPSTIEMWLTHDGHWREPGGYHSYPVSKLIESGIMCENNGYPVFEKFPELLQASYALVKYSFPNLGVSSFGDTGRARQNTETLEFGMLMAKKYDMPIFDDMLSVIQLMEREGYNRGRSGVTGILCYLPEIPEKAVPPFRWPRSGELDFAKAYLQRNGMDRENGMMYVVNGATYNHNHSNGMSMEIHGKGEIQGPDPGNGPNYEHPMHVTYYAIWAAHNTVIAAGSSTSVPIFRGSGGTKHIGEIKLRAMEPLADQSAVSEDYSFTDTEYFENSTETNQQRVMALVRTSPTSGYYLDIYKSDNPISNDYIYHNVGDTVILYGENGERLPQASISAYPTGKDDLPGLRHFKNVKMVPQYNYLTRAVFESRDVEGGSRFMQVVMPFSWQKVYYTAEAPPSKTVAVPYNTRPTPVLAVRTEGPKAAWSEPFVSVFEPYRGTEKPQVKDVIRKPLDVNCTQIVVTVTREGGAVERFFHSQTDQTIRDEHEVFKGAFGIVAKQNRKTTALYLGEGTEIGDPSYIIRSRGGSTSASVKVKGNELLVSSNDPVTLTIKDAAVKNVSYTNEKGQQISLARQGSTPLVVHLPKCENWTLSLK